MRLIYGKYTGVRARRVLVFDTNTAAFLGGRLTAGCLTAIKSAKLTFCFVGGGCACRRRLPGGNGYAGSALHPQGTSSLDPGLRKKKIRERG